MLPRLSVTLFFINCTAPGRFHNTKKSLHVIHISTVRLTAPDNQIFRVFGRKCRDIQALREMKSFGKYPSKLWSLSL